MRSNSLPAKRPRLSEDFQESLICQLCAEYFSPPIIQCVKGHSFCASCIWQLVPKGNTDNKPCPVCRAPITASIRNYALEKMLEKCEVPCAWSEKGCEELVLLTTRSEHEKQCRFRPRILCYYHCFSECSWAGSAEALVDHLLEEHCIQELTRASLFRYLWNPPMETCWRFRYRILNQVVSPDSEPLRFLLEHYYSSSEKLLVFLVRACQPGVRKHFKLSIVNRKNESNRICFEGTTVDFEEVGHIKDFLQTDLTKVLVVPYAQIKSFCFYCEEDRIEYFSLHILFE